MGDEMSLGRTYVSVAVGMICISLADKVIMGL